jgi:hypothetical protein
MQARTNIVINAQGSRVLLFTFKSSNSLVLLLFFRSVKCIEINKESKLSFEKTADRLPKFVDSSISWHHADAAKVGC